MTSLHSTAQPCSNFRPVGVFLCLSFFVLCEYCNVELPSHSFVLLSGLLAARVYIKSLTWLVIICGKDKVWHSLFPK